MPAGLHRHVRYPELLFKLQAAVYGLYHMTQPEVFFNREDLWTVATETGNDSEGNQGVQPMEPNYVLMKLPDGAHEEFVEILPFTPANRNNLIGWVAGRCDGPNLGTAMVYDFPKTRLVDGPQQIEARIDQNAQLSGQLTLWNQQGSHVLRGSLLVIPTGRALLYAEPIYLQAQQSPMPELRIVVLALQDKLAYGPTFGAALSSLFGGEPSSLTASEAPQPSPGANAASGAGTATLATTTAGTTVGNRHPWPHRGSQPGLHRLRTPHRTRQTRRSRPKARPTQAPPGGTKRPKIATTAALNTLSSRPKRRDLQSQPHFPTQSPNPRTRPPTAALQKSCHLDRSGNGKAVPRSGATRVPATKPADPQGQLANSPNAPERRNRRKPKLTPVP